jgi:GH15 family glucan-1,4-alpha-glucosidase
VDGYELGAEAVIETLPGYAGSRPVRVGNAANRQVQLDVFGPIADLLRHLADLRGGSSEWQIELMGDMVEAVSRRWHEPDHGIWEARIPPRHHVYSKVMGWLTVDRALRIGERHGMPIDPAWPALRDKIAEDVLVHGWHDEVGAYTVAYGDRTSTRPRCGSACPACCPTTTRASSPPCSRSRRTSEVDRSSTGTAGTTACPATRAASTSAARG